MRQPALKENEFLERIRAGETIEAADAMPDEYRDNVLFMLEILADSELSGAYGYAPWIQKAPTPEEKLWVARTVREEIRHSQIAYQCLEALGVDVDQRMREWDSVYYNQIRQREIGFSHYGENGRQHVIYYPARSWTDFVVCNFCIDRAAYHQLGSARDSSYGPWTRAVDEILKDEAGHMDHGEVWVKRLAGNPETRAELEKALNRCFSATVKIFWDPRSKRHESYRKWGLRKQNRLEAQAAFCREVREKAKSFGLQTVE